MNTPSKRTNYAGCRNWKKKARLTCSTAMNPAFCLTSDFRFGWRFPGEHVATQSRQSQRFNVFGLCNATTNALHTAAREGTLDAAFVTDTLDAWVATCTRPTVLVLDNARLHHTTTF